MFLLFFTIIDIPCEKKLKSFFKVRLLFLWKMRKYKKFLPAVYSIYAPHVACHCLLSSVVLFTQICFYICMFTFLTMRLF